MNCSIQILLYQEHVFRETDKKRLVEQKLAGKEDLRV